MIDPAIRRAVEEYLLEMIEGKREKKHFGEIAKEFNEKFNTNVLNKNNVYSWYKKLLEKRGGRTLPKEAREVDVQVTEGERYAQVFELFKKSKSPVEVVMECKLSPGFVIEAYKKYREMEELGEKVECFTVPCSRCGQLLERKSTDEDWDTSVKPALKTAFGDRYHEGCPKQVRPPPNISTRIVEVHPQTDFIKTEEKKE